MEHLNLLDPTPVQVDIVDYIQSGVKRSIVEAFRGVGKSYITAAYVVHQLLLNPDRSFWLYQHLKQELTTSHFPRELLWRCLYANT